jgi:hypothetical protein
LDIWNEREARLLQRRREQERAESFNAAHLSVRATVKQYGRAPYRYSFSLPDVWRRRRL